MGDEKAPETAKVPDKDPPARSGAGSAGTSDPILASQDVIGNAGVARVARRAVAPPSALNVAVGGLAGYATGLGLGPLWGPHLTAAVLTFPTDYELKGSPRFDPDPVLAWRIWFVGPTRVGVKFGDLARGTIVVSENDNGYQSRLAWLPMEHPDLKPRRDADQLGIAVRIVDGEITGTIGVHHDPGSYRGPRDPIHIREDALFPVLFGRSYHGPLFLKLHGWHNALRGGHLQLQSGFQLRPPDGPPVLGGFALFDEVFSFAAESEIVARGLVRTKLPLARSPAGLLTARQPIEFAQEWTGRGFSGRVSASFVDGSFEARARVTFEFPASKRIRGQVNVVLTSPERAWAIARSHSPGPIIAPGLDPASPGTELALTGWGTLDLDITKGVTVNGAFVVDPDGYVTARGVLRAPPEVELIKAYEWEAPEIFKPISWELAEAELPVIPLARLEAEVKVSLDAGATIGPVSLRNVFVQGLYSTRPGLGSRLDISASLNASAEAWLKARAAFEGAAEVGFEVFGYEVTFDPVSISLAVEGNATVAGYADVAVRLQPEPDKGIDPATGDPKYRVSGRAEMAGQFTVGLRLTAGIDLFGLLTPSIGVNIVDYTIGQGGIGLDIDHVIGSGQLPKVTWGRKPAFDPKKFVRRIRSDKAPVPRGTGDAFRGSFRDAAGKVSKLKQGKPPKALEPPPAGFEVRLPFEIADRPHELFLVLSRPPVVQLSSGPRERLSTKVAKAKSRVEKVQSAEKDPTARALLDQQRADLTTLEGSANALEDDATEVAADPDTLTTAHLPGLTDVAVQLAEYGERYQDPDVAGATALSTRELERTVVQPETAVVPGTATAVQEASEAVQQRNARERAREATQAAIDEIDRKLTEVTKGIERLGKEVGEARKEEGELKRKIDNSTGDTRKQLLKELREVQNRLKDEEGSGLLEEEQGYYQERIELQERKTTFTEALVLERPALREGTKTKIRDKAERRADGVFKCASTKVWIEDGNFHYGHKYGREHRRLAVEGIEKRMNQEQFNDWVNNHPEWFQIETEEANLSHAYEKPGLD